MYRSRGATPDVNMDVHTNENAALYFLRDELHGFVLDLTAGREGPPALARVLERWVRRLAGAEVTIEPGERIDDQRWRWHVGLDVDATAILNALYRGEAGAPPERERIVGLVRLELRDAGDALEELA